MYIKGKNLLCYSESKTLRKFLCVRKRSISIEELYLKSIMTVIRFTNSKNGFQLLYWEQVWRKAIIDSFLLLLLFFGLLDLFAS